MTTNLAKAKNFFGMLKKGPDGKPVGKIMVVYYGSDAAMIGSASPAVNNENRLGLSGHKYDGEWKVHDDYKNHVVSFPVTDFLTEFKDDSLIYHSYQFEPACLFQIYKAVIVKETKTIQRANSIGMYSTITTNIAPGFYTIKNKRYGFYLSSEGDKSSDREREIGTGTKLDSIKYQWWIEPKEGNDVHVRNANRDLWMFFVNAFWSGNQRGIHLQDKSYMLKIQDNGDGTFSVQNHPKYSSSKHKWLSFYDGKLQAGHVVGENEKWYIERV